MTRLDLSEELYNLVNEYLQWYAVLWRRPHFNSDNLFNDFMAIPDGEGDKFFERYGVGNALYEIKEPHERLKAYELWYSPNKIE